jgi:Cu(I)/Ag(I) efflux system membrane fusion protein
VVTRGNFKIDSALQIQARPSMMNPEAGTPAPAHDHGQDTGDGEAMAMPAAFAVPQGVTAQLTPLTDDYAALEQAVEEGDLSRAQSAFAAFHETIAGVDGSALTGDAALAFKELSMLLTNDALIGSEAETLGNARFEFSRIKKSYERLYADFGLAEAAEAREMVRSVPDEFKEQLGRVFTAYAPLRKALAGDDMDAAKAALPGVVEAVNGVDMGLLSHEPHMIWMKQLGIMRTGLTALAEAEDITAMRAGFEPLSIGLAHAMDQLGFMTDTLVYQLYCPMAFQNKGAIWLQAYEAIENPYFGAAMFACGEVQKELGPK